MAKYRCRKASKQKGAKHCLSKARGKYAKTKKGQVQRFHLYRNGKRVATGTRAYLCNKYKAGKNCNGRKKYVFSH